MKTIRAPFAFACARALRLRRQLILISITIGLFAGPLLIASAKTKRHRKPSRELAAVEQKQGRKSVASGRQPENEGIQEDVDARDNWFWRPRMYPFGELPDRARERAWAARPVNKGIKPETLSWVSIGPVSTASSQVSTWGTTSGRVSAIAVSPADANLVLIGSPTGGLWRSTDAGVHFSPVADNLTEISIGSIAFAPSNSAIAYASAGDDYNQVYFGQGVLKSTDGGATWAKVSDSSLPGPSVIRQVAVSPTDPSVVYAIEAFVKNTNTDGQVAGGFWRSMDGGVTWKKTASGLFRSMAIRPGAPQTLYLGANRNDSDGGTGGVYISTDGGLTWNISERSAFTTTADMRVAVTPIDPNKIYVYEGGNNGGPRQLEVEISSDGGLTWSDRGTRTDIDPSQFGYNTFIAVSPANANVVIIGARDLFRSTDGGLNFTNIVGNYAAPGFFNYTPEKATTHSDQQSFAFSPTDANTIYFSNDGGLFKTTDGGTTLTSLNNTLSLTQFAGYSIDPADSGRSYGGTQDNGPVRNEPLEGSKQRRRR